MPTCSVIGCRGRRTEVPNLTLHRLPTNKKRSQQWIQMIGEENINFKTKTVSICSLHFDKSCFNRTLNVTKLRDEAVPSIVFPSVLRTSSMETLNEQSQDLDDDDTEEITKVTIISEVSNCVKITHFNDSTTRKPTIPIILRSDLQDETKDQIRLCKLKEKYKCQRKKIINLQRMIKRHKNRISTFLSMIKKMKEIKSKIYTDHTYI